MHFCLSAKLIFKSHNDLIILPVILGALGAFMPNTFVSPLNTSCTSISHYMEGIGLLILNL